MDPFFRCVPRLLTGPGLAGLREARACWHAPGRGMTMDDV